MFPDESWSRGEVVDLRALESTCCFCENPSEVISALNGVPLDAVHLIDSGDYHYLTLFFLQRIREPFRLLLLDNHPDDQPPAFAAEMLSCGGWVKVARESLENLKSVHWNEKAQEDLPVYVSIDLDFLGREEARTDWSQGSASLADLETLLPRGKVLGIDICGGITSAKGGTAEDFRINCRTREKLLETIESKY